MKSFGSIISNAVFRLICTCFFLTHFITSLKSADFNLYPGEYVSISISAPGTFGGISWTVGSPTHLNVINADSPTATIGPISYYEGTESVTCYYAYKYYVGTTPYYGNGSVSYTFSCKPVNITLNKAALSLAVSEKAQLTVTHSPSSAPTPEIRWMSSDTNVATVEDGVVTAVNPGTAVITAGNGSGPNSPTCTVVVERIYPTSISLPSEVEINGRSSYRLTPELSPARSTAKYTWTTSNDKVATISNGLVKGVSAGEAEITVTTDNGLTSKCRVRVLPVAIESLKSGKKTIYVEEETRLAVSVLPSNATEGLTDFNYISDQPSIVSIDSDGMMRGIAEGEATITVTGRSNPSLTAQYSITVVETNYAKGKKFKGETIEGVNMTFVVLDADARTVEAGYYDSSSANGYCISKSTAGHVTIPDKIYGYTVVSIAKYAFENNKKLTSVTVPSTITKIGTGAFYNCPNLESIELPNSIKTIPSYMFSGDTTLVSIDIPQSVTTVNDRAFSFCKSLKHVTLHDSITTIGEFIFLGCTSLTSVKFPSNIEELTEGMFKDCTSLEAMVVPSTIKNIGAFCFEDCTSLSLINIPDGVEAIGQKAIDGTLLYELMPEGLVYINNILYTYKGMDSMPQQTIINVKEGTIYISPYAFRSCTNLIGINMPNSVRNIGNNAFYSCKGLTSIIFPDRITEISKNICRECTGLVEVHLPQSLISIGSYAFEGCSKIQSLELPANIKEFGSHAFADMSSLREVKSYIEEPEDLENVVFSKANIAKCILYVPAGTESIYKSKEIWKLFKTIEEFDIPTFISDTPVFNNWEGKKELYDLSGRRVNSDKYNKQIIITGGRKFLMKKY